ncbi:unnamed protein product [Orchesella dallaii]|uniref:Uncharacterized protein n=1 Tax=Orchesella dallaii TaxID=48710 RepID=A0ABP1S1A4_9HEXA
MRCGGDRYVTKELQRQNDTYRDMVSLIESSRELIAITLHVRNNLVNPIRIEKIYMEQKIWFFQHVAAYVLKTPVVSFQTYESNFKTLRILHKMTQDVGKFRDAFVQRVINLYKVWTTTYIKWVEEERQLRLDMEGSHLQNMSRDERKSLVKLWKERELIAAEEKIKFDDLKAEWDELKGKLDQVVMGCLYKVAEMREHE